MTKTDNVEIAEQIKQKIKTNTSGTIRKFTDQDGKPLLYPILIKLEPGGSNTAEQMGFDWIWKDYHLIPFMKLDKVGDKKPNAAGYFVMKNRPDHWFPSPFKDIDWSTYAPKHFLPKWKDSLSFGWDIRRWKPYTKDLSQTPHFFIGGESGSGKSVMMVDITKQVLEKGWQVIIVEKGQGKHWDCDYLKLYQKYQDQVPFYSNDEKVGKNMTNVLNLLLFLAVYTQIQATKDASQRKRMLIVLDEFETLCKTIEQKDKKTYKEFLTTLQDLFAKARSADVSIMIWTQNSRNIDSSIKGNIATAFLGKTTGDRWIPSWVYTKSTHLPLTKKKCFLFKEYSDQQRRLRSPMIKEYGANEREKEEIIYGKDWDPKKEVVWKDGVGKFYSANKLKNNLLTLIKENPNITSKVIENEERNLKLLTESLGDNAARESAKKVLKSYKSYLRILYFLYLVDQTITKAQRFISGYCNQEKPHKLFEFKKSPSKDKESTNSFLDKAFQSLYHENAYQDIYQEVIYKPGKDKYEEWEERLEEEDPWTNDELRQDFQDFKEGVYEDILSKFAKRRESFSKACEVKLERDDPEIKVPDLENMEAESNAIPTEKELEDLGLPFWEEIIDDLID